MKIRLEQREIPDKPTYVSVDLPGRQPHHFRLPTLTEQQRLNELGATARGASGALEAAAVLLGISWYHEILDLEVDYPEDDTDHALRLYARAVQRDLEDYGYSPVEVSILLGRVSQAARERLSKAVEAIELADFGPPPTDMTISPSLKSQSSGVSQAHTSDGPTSSG